jgi:hypothetical protein
MTNTCQLDCTQDYFDGRIRHLLFQRYIRSYQLCISATWVTLITVATRTTFIPMTPITVAAPRKGGEQSTEGVLLILGYNISYIYDISGGILLLWKILHRQSYTWRFETNEAKQKSPSDRLKAQH